MGDAGLHHLSSSPREQTQNIVVVMYSEGGVLAPAVTKPPSGSVKSQIKSFIINAASKFLKSNPGGHCHHGPQAPGII